MSAFPASFRRDPVVAALRTQTLAAARPCASRLAIPALLLGALALMPSAPAQAVEIPFGARDITTSADGAISPFPADLDGDGDLDLVLGSREDDTIAWYENDGSQNYARRVINTQADSVRSVFVIDLDSDGDLDVLAASAFNATVAWYENNGAADPGFTARTITTNAQGARFVSAADLDGDGDIDVASASLNDDKLAWYQNDGNQNFTTRVITTSADAAFTILPSDVDGDGDLDLVSASLYDNEVAWYENNGAAMPTFSLRLVSTNVQRLLYTLPADLDGDGDIDLATASYNDDKIAWFQNDGNQNFTLRTISLGIDGAFSLFAADLDGDGDLDLASGAYHADRVDWYENNGAAVPTFSRRTISTAANGAQFVLAADLDGDGDLDLTSGSRIDDALATYDNQSIHRSAVFPQRNVVSNTAGVAQSVISADLDGDGDLDVLSASASDNKIAWYENNGSQNFGLRTISTDAFGAQAVFAIDVDADGDLDALSASAGDDKIAWYENDGSENFTQRVIDTSADGATSVFALDVDRDGDVDVLSASATDGKIAWYENDGSQAYRLRVISSEAVGANSVFAIDVDGDGDVDVLSASGVDDKIAWYENDGSQGFTLRVIDTAADGASSVMALDVDADGDVDVVAASGDNDRIAWYENDGNQNFSLRVISATADGATSVFAADLDADGDVDMASTSLYDNKLAWYENDGSQSFTPRTVSVTAAGATSVFASDVDGDGDVDLAAASQTDNTIALYPNRGGQFALDTLDLAPASVTSGDDGVPVLRIDALHRGRAGDHRVQLSTLQLLFDDGATPLNSAQANALVDRLSVYRDDGDTAFNPGIDALLTSVTSLNLSAGVYTLSFADGDATATYSFGQTPTYFVTLDLASDADGQTPDTLRVTHLTESSSTARDADAAAIIPLRLEFAENVGSGTLAPAPPAPDTTPDAFSFIDIAQVAVNSVQVSNAVTIAGINVAAPISVTGGTYSIGCDGSFTDAAGTVSGGQTVCLRHTASASFSTATDTTLTVGGVANTYTSTTLAEGATPDTTPEAFGFTPVTGVPLGASQTSNSIVVSGFDGAAAISVVDGVYSIGCTGTFMSFASTINSGQTLCVRHTAAAANGTTVTTGLTIGGVTGSFSSTTMALDPAFQVQNLRTPSRCFQPEDGSPSAGDPMSAKICNTSNAAQRLSFPVNPGGSVRMVIANLCVGTPSGNFADGTRLQLQACNGSSTQNFVVSNGRFAAANAPNQVMDLHAQNFNDVLMYQDYGSTNQRWNLIPLGGGPPPPPPPSDTTPEPFSFTSVSGVAPGSTQTSNAITVAGINAPAAISVANGSSSYSIGCTATFASVASTISNGQTVCVRHTASASNSATVTTTLNIGGVTGSFSSTTLAADTTPDAFSFTSVSGVPLSAAQVSNAITVAGINAAAPVSVTGGFYSIGCTADTFTNAAGTIANGQTVCVRHTSSAGNATTVTTTLNIGGVTGSFASTTAAEGPPPPDTTPDAFSFNSVTDAPLGATQTSNPITVSGINTPAPISVANGGSAYSIGCTATFTDAASTITNGQTVCVRHTSSALNATTVTTTLNIGGVTGSFSSATVAEGPPPPDSTPDAFSFTSLSDVPLASTQTSNPITVSGINTPAAIGVADGLYSIGCTATFTDAASTIANGQTVCVRHTSSAGNATTVTTTLNIGGVTGSFASTTAAEGPPPPDTTPDAFSFTAVTGVALGSVQTSNAVTVAGINAPAPISVANGGSAYSIGCTATFTSAAGTIANGQSVCVRHTASASNAATVTTTLNIGGVTGSFSSTTLAATGDAAFQVQNARTSSRCLQPEDGSPSAGDAMSAKICNVNNAAQRLTFPVNTDGSRRMALAGLCVGTNGGVADGTRLQLQACNGSSTQKFIINGTRFAAASAPNQVMDLHAQNLNDVLLYQDYGSTNQRWNLVPLGNGGPPPPDTAPDAFNFTPLSNVPLGSIQTSNAITVSGIDSAASITVSGGLYSIGCTATFTSAASTISNGQTVCLRHTASASNATTVTTTLNIGGVTGSFASTTVGAPPPPGGPSFQVRNTTFTFFGKCLQPDDGSPSAGDLMSAKACSASPAQNLSFPANPDGTVRMVIAGLCIGSSTGSFNDGARLQLQACNGAVSQNFVISGTRFAAASSPNQVMDLHGQNANDVIFWQDYGSANQRWNLLPR